MHREKMITIPEDLSEYARIHTGPGSWSAESFEAPPKTPARRDDLVVTPRAPFVELWREVATEDRVRNPFRK